MNAILRNTLLAIGVAGSLSLAACKTDDSMDSSAPMPAPAPWSDQTMPTDSTTPPPTNPTDTTTPPDDTTTPPTTP